MGTRSLAEAVIIQSLEDLWRRNKRKESISFFRGAGFIKYAYIAGMQSGEKSDLLNLFDKLIRVKSTSSKRRVNNNAGLQVRGA